MEEDTRVSCSPDAARHDADRACAVESSERYCSRSGRPALVAHRFKVGRRIGGKSDVYHGVDLEDGAQVAIKLERRDRSHPQLDYEYEVYDRIERCHLDKSSFLRMRYYGEEGDYIALVLDLAGPSLKDLFLTCKRQFSVQTAFQLGIQMLDRIEAVHHMGYIMRKLKPRDFVMSGDVVVPIDFVLFKKFRRRGVHVPYAENRPTMARVKYASLATNFGIEASRRDDLESLLYILIYFMRGRLPWSFESRDAWDEDGDLKVAEKKAAVPVRLLCAGLPPNLEAALRYVRRLRFEEDPDYALLRRLFLEVLDAERGTDPSPRRVSEPEPAAEARPGPPRLRSRWDWTEDEYWALDPHNEAAELSRHRRSHLWDGRLSPSIKARISEPWCPGFDECAEEEPELAFVCSRRSRPRSEDEGSEAGSSSASSAGEASRAGEESESDSASARPPSPRPEAPSSPAPASKKRLREEDEAPEERPGAEQPARRPRTSAGREA